MFPICDRQGRVVAFSGRILDAKSHPAKYVNSPETDIFIKSRVLYALDKAAAKIVKHPRREAIICEGQIDVIRCHACGFERPWPPRHRHTPMSTSARTRSPDSVVGFDGDSAGRKAALRTARSSSRGDPRPRVAQPKGDDPDSMQPTGARSVPRPAENAASQHRLQVETLRRPSQRTRSTPSTAWPAP
jgi:DNA primase